MNPKPDITKTITYKVSRQSTGSVENEPAIKHRLAKPRKLTLGEFLANPISSAPAAPEHVSKDRVSTKKQISKIGCDLSSVIPHSVGEHIVRKLPNIAPCKIKLIGGAARKKIFGYGIISDIDLVVETKDVASTEYYLAGLGFNRNKKGIWTYHPPEGLVFADPAYFSSTYSIDIHVINPYDKIEPLPCFLIDTLLIEVDPDPRYSYHGIFARPNFNNLFDLVWRSNMEVLDLPPPAIPELIEKNPLAIFRVLRLMFSYNLYTSKKHRDLLIEIHKYIAKNANSLSKIKFGEFIGELNKFFWRGNAYQFFIGTDKNMDLRDVFLKILEPTFQQFYKIISKNNLSAPLNDVILRDFILSELHIFDNYPHLTDAKMRSTKLLALLLFPEFANVNSQQISNIIVRNAISSLTSKFSNQELPTWLQLNEDCFAIKEITVFL